MRTATAASLPITVVILTHNEAENIGPCLDSCAWCDDVHVLDSGSTDGTVEIARARGAQVHHHAFESFGAQHNWAIDNIPTQNVWHFHLDADERFTPALVREMEREIGADGAASDKAAYFVPSKLMFLGRWLRYSGGYPTYQVRFFHAQRCRFIDFGHGQREETSGEIGTLKQPYLHFNFSKGLSDWIEKHNRYSTREAAEALKSRERGANWKSLLSAGGVERRRALKSLVYGLPGRAFARFIYSYLLRGGWRDGTPGLHYCLLIASYEHWTTLKTQELAGAQRERIAADDEELKVTL